MAVKFSNNAVTTLSADISAGATSFTVASASTFPTLASGDWTYVSLTSEVVKVTAISGTTFTCDATSNAHASGESVELRMTAELLNDFAEDTEALPLAGGAMTGAITTTSTFDGRDVSVDGAKLDDIEYLSNSLMVASGTIDRQDDSNVFETVVGNEYKMANTDRFKNLDGVVLDTYGPEKIPEGSLSTQADVDTFSILANGVSLVLKNGMVLATNTTVNYPRFGRNITGLTIGKAYKLTLHIQDFSTDRVSVYFADSSLPSLVEYSSGVKELIFIPNSATEELRIQTAMTQDNGSVTIDNISIKEITQADLTADMPEVQVQDQATNGLVVQSAVSAGDYVVVDKEELITNGTFDTDVSGWSSANGYILTNENNTLKVESVGTSDFGATQSFTTEVGKSYYISVNVLDTNGNGWSLKVDSLIDNRGNYGSGVKAFTFTAVATTTSILLGTAAHAVGSICYFDNVSVQLKEDIYRATEDIPALTSLTDARFETRDYVSNQIATTTLSDGTINSEVFFTDMTETDTVHDAWTANGWSKLSNGLYSKGLLVGTPMGVWQTLNKGAYHPMFNAMGTRAFYKVSVTTAGPWHIYDGVDNGVIDSIAWLFDADNIGVWAVTSGVAYAPATIADANNRSGRPDLKLFDIIYPDQWIDCRIEANECNPVEELSAIGTKAKSGNVDGVSGLVSSVAAYSGITTVALLRTTINYQIYDNEFNYGIGNVAVGDKVTVLNTDTGNYMIGTIVSILVGYFRVVISEHVGFDYGSVSYQNNGNVVLSITRTLPILSSNTHLTTDLIGDPANYPQDMKDILAIGKPLVGINSLLVGQDGTSYLNASDCVMSEKMVQEYLAIYNNDAHLDEVWSTWQPTGVDLIKNFTSMDQVPLSRVSINPYTAKNTTTKATDPKTVKAVGNYVTATNSHSIYKGNQLVPTGKVNVGNGANSVERKVLEDSPEYIFTYDYDTDAGTQFYDQDTRILETGSGGGVVGKIYTPKIYFKGTAPATAHDFGVASPNWWATDSLPSHSTLALDNAVSPAVKLLETIAVDADGMAHYQLFSEEMDWDYTVDRDNIVTYTAGQGAYTLNEAPVKFVGFTNSELNNKVYTTTGGTITWLASTLDLYHIGSDGVVYRNSDGVNIFGMKLWDGNGFGSDGKFNQLTNGTRTDDNGNTVKTIVSSIPLNKYLGGN